MEKDKIVICRPFYCEDCYNLNRVIEGKLFTVYGTHHQSVFVRKANWHGIRGITPHMIFFDGVIKDNLYEILVACSMNDCGIRLFEVPDQPGSFDMEIKKARKVYMKKEEWETLKTFNDKDYRID